MGMSGCVGVGIGMGAAPCRCTGCPRALEAPPKPSKMKMFKKIKKKIGIGRAACIGGSASTQPPHGPLPALTFHAVHGDNIRLSRDTSTAKRVESFCKGVAFSARQVMPNERICIRFTETSTNWSGVLRFGYTSQDPALLAGALPKYACPDLTNKPGYWAKALTERLFQRGGLLTYYVTHSGDVHFCIDGEDNGVFFYGVDTKGPLWALVDIYGNCTGIQFVDSRSHLNNQQRIVEFERNPVIQQHDEQIESIIPAMRATTINPDGWKPVAFHRTCGRHIRLGPEPGVASRVQTEFNQGYVFTSRPLAPGEKLLIKILETERSYVGALAIGLTSCDPSKLTPRDLPDDSDMLLDRPEYWVVSKDVAGCLGAGEDLVLSVTPAGEVKISVNGRPPATVMYVDNSLRLWAFLDIFGATRRIHVSIRPLPSSSYLVVALPPPHANGMPPQGVSSAASSTSLPLAVNAPMSPPPGLVNQRNHQVSANSVIITRTPSAGAIPHTPVGHPQSIVGPSVTQQIYGSSQSTIATTSNQIVHNPSQMAFSHLSSQSTVVSGSLGECTICYEHHIDSVLYACGHMCMCYRCAVQQWKGKGGGQCPLCRASIRDVIRTYKS